MNIEPITQSLLEAAREAREHAYAPYSGYAVGAAILDSSGRVWTGANIENVSYGLTLCAERVALAKMVSAGSREIDQVAVVTKDGGTPCGMCLQSLLEFAPKPRALAIAGCGHDGEVWRATLDELLPFGFKSEAVNRTEQDSG